MATAVNLYALWVGRNTQKDVEGHKTLTFYYHTIIPPTTPLQSGIWAKILLLSNTRFRARLDSRAPPTYDVYDQKIEGFLQETSTKVGGAGHPLPPDLAVFKIENRASGSVIKYAIVTIPRIPGYTVLPLPRTLSPPHHPTTPNVSEATKKKEPEEGYEERQGNWRKSLEMEARIAEVDGGSRTSEQESSDEGR
ncbi:hypothetical protein C8Q76DRAFT_796995 [Earliella scabrosa]|nr:hypothetical protein C8Q76DRAFT_796995 [Earliella scabrosa]